jgi:hypothetical protein
LPVIDKFSICRIVGEIGVETKRMKSLTLRSYTRDSSDNSVADGRKENDLTFVTQAGFKFRPGAGGTSPPDLGRAKLLQ